MNLADFNFLLSPAGRHLLQETAAEPLTEQSHLQIATRLRHEVEPGQAQAIVETVWLRQRARTKFSRADEMFFTRDGLEQATAEIVADYRARRFAAGGYRHVTDLGCGLGGDALALAATGAHEMVTGLDRDRLRLLMARENVAIYGGNGFEPIQADLDEFPPLPAGAFFFDPARRDERGRRIHSVQDYQPPLSLVDRWRPVVPDGAVKISPGVDYAELPPDADVEFISLHGEVKEALLWYGALRSGAGRRATLLPGGDTLTDEPLAAPVAIRPPQEYLYEPDGAVIRAHLIEQLAVQLGASKIDDNIAYVTAPQRRPTPFARCYEIEDTLPFHLKRLRQYLRERNVGQVTIKKRGSPLTPETLRRQLRLNGEEHRILFLTQVEGEPVVLIGREAGTDRGE